VSDKSILIVGGDSLVGGALAGVLAADGHSVHTTSRRSSGAGVFHLDLADPAPGLAALPDVDTVVLAAAVARLGDCEADPDGSRRVNVTGTFQVARAMAARGAQILFLSTDKVFDGTRAGRTAGEATCPMTEYGRQKAAAEEGVLGLDGPHAVLRLTKVLDGDLALIAGWRRDLRAGRQITPFLDMFMAPVTLNTIARTATAIVSERAGGIFHCSGGEDRPYAEFAAGMAKRLGADQRLVGAVATPAHVVPAGGLVRHSTLDMTTETRRWGITPPDFAAVLDAVAD
jgi:dTDP-4-dehydrorhamnose reductase